MVTRQEKQTLPTLSRVVVFSTGAPRPPYFLEVRGNRPSVASPPPVDEAADGNQGQPPAQPVTWMVKVSPELPGG